MSDGDYIPLPTDFPEPKPRKRRLRKEPKGERPADLREAVERFLRAREALENIPDGEAGDAEIGRRAELASGLHEDMDVALEDMRAALLSPEPSRDGVL